VWRAEVGAKFIANRWGSGLQEESCEVIHERQFCTDRCKHPFSTDLPKDLLSFFANNRTLYILSAVIVLTWATVSVPFVVALGTLLGDKGHSLCHSLALSATLLSAAGILLLGFGVFIFVGAGLSIVAAADLAPSPADAAYQFGVWANLSYYLTDPGLMTWGLGQFLFGMLAWNSKVLANWLAIIGLIGGSAGLLTLAVYQSSVLALVQTGCFAVWGIAMGIHLLRREDSASTKAPMVNGHDD